MINYNYDPDSYLKILAYIDETLVYVFRRRKGERDKSSVAFQSLKGHCYSKLTMGGIQVSFTSIVSLGRDRLLHISLYCPGWINMPKRSISRSFHSPAIPFPKSVPPWDMKYQIPKSLGNIFSIYHPEILKYFTKISLSAFSKRRKLSDLHKVTHQVSGRLGKEPGSP